VVNLGHPAKILRTELETQIGQVYECKPDYLKKALENHLHTA
jgi:hypothetical protein